ncbi:MAG: hypothetical protein R3F48_00725 [Candidatus Zixiibacteriota bacterium]
MTINTTDANELFRDLRKKSGPFPDWDEKMISDAHGYHKIFVLYNNTLIGKGNVQEKDLINSLRYFYGFIDNEEYDSIAALACITNKFYPDEEKVRLEKVKFGNLPRLIIQNPETGESEAQRASSAFALPCNDNSFLVVLTTQLIKILQNWMTLLCSVESVSYIAQRGPKISAADILDGMREIIQCQWINAENPHTFGMNFLPEIVANDPFWNFRIDICMFMTLTFILHHEVGHILRRHFKPANNINDSILYRRNNNAADAKTLQMEELEADEHSAIHLSRIIKSYPRDFVNDWKTYIVIQLCEWLALTDLFYKYSKNDLGFYPDAIKRGDRIIDILSEELVISQKASLYMALRHAIENRNPMIEKLVG